MQSRRTGKPARHETIAFLTNHPTRFGWRPRHHHRPDFFPGAAQRAQELGYKLEHFWLAEPGMTPRRFCDILVTRDIHGIVVARMPPGVSSLELPWEHFSVVALGLTLQTPQFHHVTENHFDTAARAMRACHGRGYRRVGFVFSEANDSPRVAERWVGAYLQCQQSLPKIEPLPICPGAPTDRATFSRWLKHHRPDALIVTQSAPVLKWLHALQREVPRDVGLVALQGNQGLGSTGVHYDPIKIGAIAVEMLAGLLYRNERGVPADPYEVTIAGEWRDGRTLPAR